MSWSHLVAFVLSLMWAGPGAAAISPSIQLGTVPRTDGGSPWRLAVPIADTVVDFDAPDARLALTPSAVGDGSWIVLTGEDTGPVSGLLRLRDSDGDIHVVSVAGEVVEANTFEGLLLRGDRPGDRIERFLRPGELRVHTADIPGARIASAVTGDSGWTRLVVQLPAGTGEGDGVLRMADDVDAVPVHVSLLESITVIGAMPLDPGFQPLRVRAIRERLQEGNYVGRVGVLGVRGDARRLRVLDAIGDGGEIFLSTRELHDIAGGATPDDRVHLSRIRHLGGEAIGARFLVLSPERATVVHPLSGLLARRQSRSLARLGAARTSRLDRNRVFAISGNGSGEWFLSALRARRVDGAYGVRQVRYSPSLQDLLGARSRRIGDLASIRYRTANGVDENLIVSVGREDGTLRLVELSRDGTTVSARRRYSLQVGDPSALRDVRLNVFTSPRAGSAGLPVRVRALVPGREVRVLRVSEPGSWSLLGRETLASFAGTGIGLAPPSFLVGGPDGAGNTDFLRYAFDGEALTARALGRADGVTVRRYRASARREHAWMTGVDTRGRGRIRVATNGLVRGTNLPPRVDAGADVRTTESRVRLRARARDANGDPLGVRWSGPGVEFVDRFARRTIAFVPPGRTPISVRARENGFLGPAGDLEALDALTVRYDDVVSVGSDPPTGLVTGLGQPAPNPGPAGTMVPFTVGSPGRVRVDVFDVHGRRVRTLLDETLSPGGYDARWDGARADGSPAAAGVYFVRLITGDRSAEQRLVLVR